MGIELAIGMAVAGQTMSAIGSIREGNTAKKSADYNAMVDDYNATYAKNKAVFDEKLLREDEVRTKGAARAIMGSSGFAVDDGGTNTDILDDMAKSFAIDASVIRTQGKAESNAYKNSAAASRWQGKQARSAGYINAFSDMLMAGSAVAGKFGGGPTNTFKPNSYGQVAAFNSRVSRYGTGGV